MTTLVTGARGRVGSTLIELLNARGLPVRAASRAPEKLTGLPADVPRVRCALDAPETFPAALDGVTSVFLYADASRLDDFLAVAATAGVRHIVLLSSSSVLVPDPAADPLARGHWAAEQALAASPITSTLLRPGAFATNALGWVHALRTTGTVRLPVPDAHAGPLHERDLAEAALAVLTDPDPLGGAHHLTGPESLTFREQLAVISRVTGMTAEAEPLAPEEWKKEVSAHLPEHIADSLLAYWRKSDGSPAETTKGIEELTGHPARSFTTWVEDHAAAFTG
ncbi:NAD(P)H-binding protein [Streptomyces luteireticuli]|uniref:NAD(P)H-binding protein n=1 Tax=Streptomyces luteireticuli TaxID=173858 RepID=UPI00355792BB